MICQFEEKTLLGMLEGHMLFLGSLVSAITPSCHFHLGLFNALHVVNVSVGLLYIYFFASDAIGPVLTFTNPSDTSSSSPMFTWRSSEQANFECSFDGRRFENCGSGITGRWSENNVRDGSHVLSIRGRDSVGNLGRTTTHDWIVGKTCSLPCDK
jgi:hypothetical protein